jgi:hypothetical protein
VEFAVVREGIQRSSFRERRGGREIERESILLGGISPGLYKGRAGDVT